MILKELIQNIENQFPLELIDIEDGRYTWPDRWDALKKEVGKLLDMIEKMKCCENCYNDQTCSSSLERECIYSKFRKWELKE